MMRITNIKLLNFKRFTDLEIKDIPETVKLVVVVGPNGCGKSSLFDAFIHWHRMKVGWGRQGDTAYYRKLSDQEFSWDQSVQIAVAGGREPVKGSLYVRTAYRNDPEFRINSISGLVAPDQSLRIERSLQNDATVSENYQRLVYETMRAVYNTDNDAKTVVALREELIGGVRTSMRAVFGDLLLNDISDPLGGGGTFGFDKGATKSYEYKNLSGGEKAAFDLLLDMHTKKKFYPDAIYCIDELETHLHTRVQGTLLKELVKILPGSSQLWVTTHSLGVLRAAQDMAAADPAAVCVIDFDPVNPDEPRQIAPSSLDRIAWEKMLSIALDDLSPRVAPNVLVVCEGSSVGSRRKDFDAEIYNRVLGSRVHGVLFISGGSSSQIAASGVSILHTMKEILPKSKMVTLCDRDEKSQAEVAKFEADGGIVLQRRNLESYLFDSEVIEALVLREQKQDLLPQVHAIIGDAIAASKDRGNAPDDLKSAAGSIYVELKRLLSLVRCGNNTDAFMRDTLAPLITENMNVYKELRSSIIDRLS
jgi:predicted ATPase